jgi:hypothetical protein
MGGSRYNLVMKRHLIFGGVYRMGTEPSELDLWRNKTPLERLKALEELRTQTHGPIQVQRTGHIRVMNPDS